MIMHKELSSKRRKRCKKTQCHEVDYSTGVVCVGSGRRELRSCKTKEPTTVDGGETAK